ncbi:MAG: amidohydrolase [Bacteroidaceae bacterium]|nr:amidohydrolase [Bacteroidaceae bacterium]
MTISLLQTDIVWGNPDENQEKISEILWGLDKSDLYVLPEMFSTGFSVDPHGIAEQDESSLTWMKNMASELKGAMCGSVATEVVSEEGVSSFYNRLYFVKPNGDVFTYDKHHLFTYADEHRNYKRGQDRVVVEYRGCRFLLQVCYDLRFPVFSRNNEKIPYDCAIYVASWPTSRLAAWDTLLHARAIENQCYVAGVNRIGEDQSGLYSGGTMMIDPYGNTAAACPLDEDSAITVELDLQKLKDFRRKFPVLKDAD